MSISLKTFNTMSVAPKDDACLYDAVIEQSGIYEGCTVTHLGSNQLRVAAGRGIIKGRTFVIEEQTIYCTLSSSGTVNGRLKIHMDLSNTEEPISFVTQAAATLPALTQNENCNYENGIYEIALATYNIDTTVITNLTNCASSIVSLADLNNNLPVEITEEHGSWALSAVSGQSYVVLESAIFDDVSGYKIINISASSNHPNSILIGSVTPADLQQGIAHKKITFPYLSNATFSSAINVTVIRKKIH